MTTTGAYSEPSFSIAKSKKVYPLRPQSIVPPLGGSQYLSTVIQPVPMSEYATLRAALWLSLNANQTLRDENAMLHATVAELDTEIGMLQASVAEQQLFIVDGYCVSLRVEDGVWVAHCPTVRVACQADSKEDAASAIRQSIIDMISAREERGRTTPPKDMTDV